MCRGIRFSLSLSPVSLFFVTLCGCIILAATLSLMFYAVAFKEQIIQQFFFQKSIFQKFSLETGLWNATVPTGKSSLIQQALLLLRSLLNIHFYPFYLGGIWMESTWLKQLKCQWISFLIWRKKERDGKRERLKAISETIVLVHSKKKDPSSSNLNRNKIKWCLFWSRKKHTV